MTTVDMLFKFSKPFAMHMAHVTVEQNIIIAAIIAFFVTAVEHFIASAFVSSIESEDSHDHDELKIGPGVLVEKGLGSRILPLELHPLLRTPSMF